MDRREFLGTPLLAFLAAAEDLKISGNADTEALVVDGFVAEENSADERIATYCMKRGVLIWGDENIEVPGCLFEDLVLTVVVARKNMRVRHDIAGMIGKLIGPAPLMLAAYEKFSNIEKVGTNTMRFGVVKGDGSRLWFKVNSTILNSVGMSVSTGGMIVTEWTGFVAHGSPELCEPVKSVNIAPREEVKEAEKTTKRSFFSRIFDRLFSWLWK